MADILSAIHAADIPVLIAVVSLLGALVYSLFVFCKYGR